MRETFHTRLRRAQKLASLTPADLSIWFARPYGTIRGWLEQGYEPWGPNGDVARHMLDLLEAAIKKHNGLPVPTHLTPVQRRAHVQQIKQYADNHARVPKMGAAR
jgi:hypothetical protein